MADQRALDISNLRGASFCAARLGYHALATELRTAVTQLTGEDLSRYEH